MTDHLPECDWSKNDGECRSYQGWDEAVYDSHRNRGDSGMCSRCQAECICERLRACEQRVRQEIDREAFVLDEGDPYREVYRAGYSKGVRDAHESASWCQDPDEMLQAIIGLLNMPPPPPLPPSVGVPQKWRP